MSSCLLQARRRIGVALHGGSGAADAAPAHPRGLAAARSAAVLALAGVGVVGTLVFLDRLQPIRHWLASTMAVIFGWQVLLNFAWLSFGLAITRRMPPRGLPAAERACISAAIGVVAFTVALYLLGALGLFRPVFAVALAVAFAASGLPALRAFWRDRLDTIPAPAPAPDRWIAGAATVFGVIGVGVVYLGLLTPDAVNYDARWIHLATAQDYARAGRLITFPGDWQRCYPHLGSMLHTWDFLVPGFSEPVTRWMMALHTEFSLFMWTLLGVGASVRWLARTPNLRAGWAAFFLFPGFLVYDGNIGGAADHVLASFMPALFLLTVRLPAQSSTRAFAAWGTVAGGALLTKYQAAYVIAPIGLLLVWLTMRAGWRPLRAAIARTAAALGWAAAAAAAVTAPHFIKNIAYHANPFYPLAQDWFHGSHPTVRDGAIFARYLLTDFNHKAPDQLGPRLRQSFELLFSFAFEPHYSFVGKIPTFGFLFTLVLPLLLVVPRARRLWAGALVSMGAVFFWASTYRVDRNLQIMLPLLAATTGAILVRAWQSGYLARVGVGALVMLQVVWGGDIWFSGSDRIAGSMNIIRSSLDGRGATRFAGMSGDYIALGRSLPKDAVLHLHHWHPQLGIDRPIILDWVGFQGLIDFRNFSNARDYYDRLRALGVTHVVHLPGNQAAPFKQEDVIFHSLAITYAGHKTRVGMFEVFPLPDVPPPARTPLQVLTLGLYGYADGLYDVTSLGTCQYLPGELQHYAAPRVRPDTAGMETLLETSDAVLIAEGHSLPAPAAMRLSREFQAATPYPGLAVYIRTPAR